MLTADHDDFFIGEEWRIVGTLLDREGCPLDLTGTSIQWTLIDERGAAVRASATMTVLDPPTAGVIQIHLPASTTSALAPGHYTDKLQVARSGRQFTIHGLSTIIVARPRLAS